MPRFAPCGREYRREGSLFMASAVELCRDPRMCPHCVRIGELNRALEGARFPVTEVGPHAGADPDVLDVLDVLDVTETTPKP